VAELKTTVYSAPIKNEEALHFNNDFFMPVKAITTALAPFKGCDSL
jgi:hypothetical protein